MTAGQSKFTVDPWDPGYGLAFTADLDDDGPAESTANIDVDFELPAGQWQPLDPTSGEDGLSRAVVFLDGVRRIEARVWLHSQMQPAPGVAASYAVGLVRCDGEAQIATVRVGHGLFTAAEDAQDIITRHATFHVHRARWAGVDALSLALQQQLVDEEVALAVEYRASHQDADDLLVVDGPLRGRTHLDRTVGYIKAHHASYLAAEQAAVVGALRPGQRSPIFTMGTTWIRHSWYLRLPGPGGSPWSGIVRLECSSSLGVEEAGRLADLTSSILPPLASSPHKDPRAPQNLVPIGGLEQRLRHQLGDPRLLYRALRAAAG